MLGAPLPFESEIRQQQAPHARVEPMETEYDEEQSHESNSTYFQYEKELKEFKDNDMGSVKSKNPKPIGRRPRMESEWRAHGKQTNFFSTADKERIAE